VMLSGSPHSLSHRLSQVAMAHHHRELRCARLGPKQNCDCTEHNRDNHARHFSEHTIKFAKLVEGASADKKLEARRDPEEIRRSLE
jgi:hypothetical protein